MFPANQDQLDAVLRGGLSIEEAMNPALMQAAGKNKTWLKNVRPPEDEEDDPRPQGSRPFGRQGFATGVAPMLNHGASGAYHAAIGGAQQGRALGDMISQTMAAHQDENDSRVSQERELRRMMHEQEIERMRQETERMKVEALLARLNQESGGGRTIRFPGGSIASV
jgi:hypothetical protein